MKRRHFLLLGAALPVAAMARRRGHMHSGMGSVPPSTTARTTPLAAGQPLADLVRLPNTSTTAGTFEGTLVAQRASRSLLPGTTTEFWTYNGLVPGPVVEVFEGDAVRVHVENRLSQDTTVHWHGLPVPPDQDGNPMDPIAPGTSRTYAFTLPVGSSGTYWYHPHTHGQTAEQVFRGMAGVFLVRPRTDPVPSAITEKLLVISDLRLAADGSIPADTVFDWQNGREGNYVLVNGQYQPTLAIAPGQTQRWRIWNATNARYLRLALDQHTFTVIGTDGGLVGTPAPGVSEILLVPGQRIEVLVTAGLTAGASAVLQSLPYDRGLMGMMGAASSTVPLLTLKYSGTPVASVALPTTLRSIVALGPPVASKRLVFSSGMGMGMGMGMGGMGAGMMRFLIDGKSFDPTRVDLTSRVDEVEQWTIENRSPMDHPFHLHGTQFQVVSRTSNGATIAETMLAWRDVVNVPALESVTFRVVQHQLGKRMYHCHILEHEDQGMMGILEVVA